MHNKPCGFTLIELMIVVAIIGILAGIAYPSYVTSVQKSKRADAQGALASFSGVMTQWYIQNNPPSYLGAAVGDEDRGTPQFFAANVPLEGGNVNYTLTIEAATVDTYTLRATPVASQVGNGYLEINEIGAKAWDRNNDGDTNDAGENLWE